MARQVPLARHLVIAKNVRGIAVFDPAAPPEQAVFTWLSRKHQYRNVGIPAGIHDAPAVDLGSYKTFTQLDLPTDALEDLKAACATEHPPWVVEALLLASAYVVPLFIHRDAAEGFEPFCRWRAETAGELPEEQVLRHMRIIGYGMLDFFESTTEDAMTAIHESAVHEELEHRETIAREDGEDRFWRLLDDEDPAETWVGGYFDILSALPDSVEATGDEAAIGLGLVGGFIIDPPYED